MSTPTPGPADLLESAYCGHSAAVLRFALRCVRRRDLAEDLTSEAFLALHHHRYAVVPAQVRSWLFTVVKNRAVDHWRRRGTEKRYAERPPLGAASASSAEDDLESLLRSPALKPVHRACLRLHFGLGMTRSEVAARTGLSETQVKGHLQYGLTLLRRHLRRPNENEKALQPELQGP